MFIVIPFDAVLNKRVQHKELGLNMNQQLQIEDPFTPTHSHLLFEPYPLVYFCFSFQELQNSFPQGSPFALCSGLYIYIYNLHF